MSDEREQKKMEPLKFTVYTHENIIASAFTGAMNRSTALKYSAGVRSTFIQNLVRVTTWYINSIHSRRSVRAETVG